jgi:hypothetical protein
MLVDLRGYFVVKNKCTAKKIFLRACKVSIVRAVPPHNINSSEPDLETYFSDDAKQEELRFAEPA